jgi:hypothetical protein
VAINMTKILVTFDRDDIDSIDRAQKIANDLEDYFRERGMYSGIRTVNDPDQTFGIIIK